ncbi:hypothetical protein [Persicitalea jodogahamensis]|uniref:hypothetical protein n=1 Tax=Persicitalea jodogahamensis TaxID=402147 RepID=UPI001673A9E4|nr:hypothetical protein [Persicitalea jodogahamensis]
MKQAQFVLVVFFIFSALPVCAQELIQRPLIKPPTEQQVFEKEVKHDTAYARQFRVKSQVIAAKSKQPVAGAFVKLPVANYSIHTDSLGSFSILLPDSLVGQPLHLVVAHPEYGRLALDVSSGTFPAVIRLPPAPPRRVEVVE